MKLALQALLKLLLGFALMAGLIFLPAGTLAFSGGWLLLAILFVPMTVAGVILLVKAPDRLRKRLDTKEKLKSQTTAVRLSALMFCIGFSVAGHSYRMGLYQLPRAVRLGAAAVFLAGYALYGVVLAQNPFLSRTVGVQEGQYVVDTGLYAIVRHPMYTATIPMFLAMPLVLGSLYALPVFLFYPALIYRRLREEEALLCEQLPGYRDYMARVKWRLISFIY